ncbi:uncharacterized protein TM35_000511070, partial [Trypanosoma theileri]
MMLRRLLCFLALLLSFTSVYVMAEDPGKALATTLDPSTGLPTQPLDSNEALRVSGALVRSEPSDVDREDGAETRDVKNSKAEDLVEKEAHPQLKDSDRGKHNTDQLAGSKGDVGLQQPPQGDHQDHDGRQQPRETHIGTASTSSSSSSSGGENSDLPSSPERTGSPLANQGERPDDNSLSQTEEKREKDGQKGNLSTDKGNEQQSSGQTDLSPSPSSKPHVTSEDTQTLVSSEESQPEHVSTNRQNPQDTQTTGPQTTNGQDTSAPGDSATENTHNNQSESNATVEEPAAGEATNGESANTVTDTTTTTTTTTTTLPPELTNNKKGDADSSSSI